MKKLILPIITVITLAAATISVRADDTNTVPATAAPATNSASMDAVQPATDADAWQFGVSVPLWAAGITGTGTVKGHQQNVDITFNELREHLDTSLALGVSARKGRLGFFGDVGYMKFSANGSLPGGGVAATGLKFVLADAGVSYQLVKAGEEHPFFLEGTLGLRYWYADSFIKLKDAGNVVLFDRSSTKDLEDPVIGLRASQFLTSKLHLDLAGDIGGFGMSDSQAKLDWSATGALTYDFTSWFSLSAGYKAVGLDYSNGSGANKNGVNLVFSGALVSLNFSF
jgi:hypothetical protein